MADLTAKLNFPTTFPVNIAAELTMPDAPPEPVSAEVGWRYEDEPESEPQSLGFGVVGKEFQAFVPDWGTRPVVLLTRAVTDKNIEVADWSKSAETVFAPNTETLTPVLWATAAATNTQIFFAVGNYSPSSKYRQIQWSLSSDFSSPTDIFHNIANTPNAQLDAEIIITRSTNLTNAETRYIRVRHKSQADAEYGAWSTPTDFNVTFADSGGGGGSPPHPTPIDCFAERTIFHLIDEEITFADLFRRFEKGILRHNKAVSFDESGNQVEGEITAVFRTLKNKWFLIEFSDGERFEVTGGHKFFTEGGYVPVKDLETSAAVLTADGNAPTLISKKEMTGSKYFYNASIAEFMNYCVGRSKFRVHNLKEITE